VLINLGNIVRVLTVQNVYLAKMGGVIYIIPHLHIGIYQKRGEIKMTTKQKEMLMALVKLLNELNEEGINDYNFGEDLVTIFDSELSLDELPFEIMSYIEGEIYND
jgi:hypothetical protein